MVRPLDLANHIVSIHSSVNFLRCTHQNDQIGQTHEILVSFAHSLDPDVSIIVCQHYMLLLYPQVQL